MKGALFLISSLILATLLAVPQPGTADMTPMDYNASPSGGGISPRTSHPAIRLDSQDVVIRLQRDSYTVDAVFHLFNTGDTSTELVGFPKNAMGRTPGPLGRVSDFIRFLVSVNDQIIPFEEERDLTDGARKLMQTVVPRAARHSLWLIGRITFPGRATTTIRLSYEAPYDNCGWECSQAVYIYGTGGYWKDAIGKASFVIDSTELGGVARADGRFFPPDTERYLVRRRLLSANVVRYEVRDFEPSSGGTVTIYLTREREDKNGTSELYLAALNGRINEVQIRINRGADVNATGPRGETALEAAAMGGHVEVAKLLLRKGARVNSQVHGGVALKRAMESAWQDRGQVEVAKLLKEHGATPTTLAVAAFAGNMEAIERFLAAGHDIHQKWGPNGQTVLMAAAMGGQLDVVKWLLDKGASVDERDKHRQTALIVTATGGHAEVVRLLLDRGANVNAVDANRRSALNHTVFLRGHVEAAKVLLDQGADINARDDYGHRTILMHAAQSGKLEMEKLLLDKGADVNAKDAGGATALNLARDGDFEEIEKVLKAHGAK